MANAPIGPILSGRITKLADRLGFEDLATYIYSPRSADCHISKDHLRKLALHDETSISDIARQNILIGLDNAWTVLPKHTNKSSENQIDDIVKINKITVDIELSNGTHLVGPIKEIANILKLAIA